MKKFTKEEIEAVRAAIRKAREDVEEWDRRARPSAEALRRPVNRFRNGKRVF